MFALEAKIILFKPSKIITFKIFQVQSSYSIFSEENHFKATKTEPDSVVPNKKLNYRRLDVRVQMLLNWIFHRSRECVINA